MKKILTPEEYLKLNEADSYQYHPEYVGYKSKKVREYETCDLGHEHFMGWVEHKYPIGEPIAYKWQKPTLASSMQMYYSKKLMGQSILSEDKFSKDTKTITFTRHTPLV